jgi:hypothetical protein
MNNETWEEWLQNFNWIMEVSRNKHWNKFKWRPLREMQKKKGWNIDDLEIVAPVKREEMEKLEKLTSQTFPEDFKTVLCEYASAVHLNWHMHEESVEEFKGIFGGGGNGYLWDFELLEYIHEDYLSWLKDCWTDPNDWYGGVYYNKVPFISVPNGDLIAFDKKIVNGQSEVIYLSHDEGQLHGHRLAKNFVEFISKWSNIGCVGTEEWQISPFYDFENKEIYSDGDAVRKWKNILNK